MHLYVVVCENERGQCVKMRERRVGGGGQKACSDQKLLKTVTPLLCVFVQQGTG